MTEYPQDLTAHLSSGTTTICRCWSVARRDGTILGFTDHDGNLSFDGVTYRANVGLTARSVEQSTGLSVDNSEVIGALSDPAIKDEDIEAGRFDGAEVQAWLVNWRSVEQRALLFRGTLGEITRSGGAFRAELRGLAEALNQPRGRVYQAACPAVLGDAACGFDLSAPGYAFEGPLVSSQNGWTLRMIVPGGFVDRWFERGTLRVLTGAASGLTGIIKADRIEGGERRIDLWESLRAPLFPGDSMRLEAGCDKRAETCQTKFDNFLNFRGFPNIPGEDWLVSYPRRGGVNDGGSLG